MSAERASTSVGGWVGSLTALRSAPTAAAGSMATTAPSCRPGARPSASCEVTIRGGGGGCSTQQHTAAGSRWAPDDGGGVCMWGWGGGHSEAVGRSCAHRVTIQQVSDHASGTVVVTRLGVRVHQHGVGAGVRGDRARLQRTPAKPAPSQPVSQPAARQQRV
jgi:hypothetical protein